MRSLLHLALALVLAAALPGPAQGDANGSWTMLAPDPNAPGPGARREFVAIHDQKHERYLVFGGFHMPEGQYTLLNEVWVLQLGATPAWRRLEIDGVVPGERHSPQWGYDPARARLLMFGGYGRHLPGHPYAYLNDVWELSLADDPHWTLLEPTGTAPAGRLAGVAVYDPLRQRFVGFGGTAGLPCDTWELDLAGDPAWASMPPDSGRPAAGYGQTAIYDPIRDRMVMFGGSTSDHYLGVHNQVWELDLAGTPVWTRLWPGGEPPCARRTLTSIYDPLRDRMVLYGGWDSTLNGTDAFLADTWALPLDQAVPVWDELEPAGTVPTGRDAMAAAYDPEHDRMVVFGGWSGEELLGDTWFLDWGGDPEDALVTGHAEADATEARLEWDIVGATGSRVGVFRRQEGTEWTSVGVSDGASGGSVAFVDEDVVPGARYAYQLLVASESGGTVGGEVWVDVPTTVGVTPGEGASFALRAIAPNPVAGAFTVSFALPGSAPARLDVYDVSGRRLYTREVGSLGAGTHRVSVDAAGAFRPGVVFVRLTQDGVTLSRRVAVTGGSGN